MEFKNLEAEMIVIGMLINTPENYHSCNFTKEIFTELFLGVAYERLGNIYHETGHLNLLSAVGICENEDQKSILSQCAFMAAGLISLSTYVSILENLYQKRNFISYFSKAVNEMRVDTHIETLIEDYTSSVVSKDVFNSRTHGIVCKDILENLDNETNSFPTNLGVLDRAMEGGLYKKKTYCIAARQKVGKTIALASISHNLSKNGVNHLFIAAEMGVAEIMQRNIAHDLNTSSIIFYDKTRQSQNFKDKLAYYVGRNKNAGLFVDAPSVSFGKLRNLIITYCKKHKIEGVILDYLQIVTGMEKGENEAQFQGRVAQWVAEIAKKENIFILYAAQLNREGQLRGSDGIRNAVDQLYYLKECKTDKKHRYLELEASRYTPHYELGNENSPCLEITKAPFLTDYSEVVYDNRK